MVCAQEGLTWNTGADRSAEQNEQAQQDKRHARFEQLNWRESYATLRQELLLDGGQLEALRPYHLAALLRGILFCEVRKSIQLNMYESCQGHDDPCCARGDHRH
jgi:hypothetical protein